MTTILNSPISAEEVETAISKLKKGKTPGLDGLPAEILILNKKTLSPHLAHLYNYILGKAEYPQQWAEGLRMALPKDGGKDIRPITITPLLGKALESIFDTRMTFLESAFNKEDKYNGGFKKHSSTTDNMFILLGCVQKQLCLGKKLHVAYVDFRKAFNFVNRNLLFWKIIKSGLHGNVVKLLINMYNKTKARVKINGVLYHFIKDFIGMNQGGPISPNLFRKFLADLIDFLKIECGIALSSDTVLLHLLWADDLILLSDSNEGLQQQLDGLYTFCKKYHMIVNEMKTKTMTFGNTKECKFMYNGKEIESVSNYKYLGVLFKPVTRCDGNIFGDAYGHIAKQARKAMFKILKDTKKIGMMPPSVALKLFDSLVLPILEYGSEIWSRNKSIDEIEYIQTKFIKIILGVNNNSSNLAIQAETGRYPLILRQKVKTLKYWMKILSLTEESLVKKMYNILYDLNGGGFKTWVTYVESMLYEAGMNNVWKDQVCDMNVCNKFKTLLFTTYSDYCIKSINCPITNPKLRTYCKFKCDFAMEMYLSSITDFKIRRQLSRFRLSNHNLCIEKGRHSKPKMPVEKRLCVVCKTNQIEDEFHFLCVCKAYQDLRDEFFIKISSLGFYGNFFNLHDILNFNEGSFNLGKLLCKMFDKRKEVLKI